MVSSIRKMGKAKAKKTSSLNSLTETQKKICTLQEQIFEYADKHVFHIRLQTMLSEAFKMNHQNPWGYIAQKAADFSGLNFENFCNKGILNELYHQNKCLQAKLDWYKKEFGNIDFKFYSEATEPKLNDAGTLKESYHAPLPESLLEKSSEPVVEKTKNLLPLKLRVSIGQPSVDPQTPKNLKVVVKDLSKSMNTDEFANLLSQSPEMKSDSYSPTVLTQEPPTAIEETPKNILKLKLKVDPPTVQPNLHETSSITVEDFINRSNENGTNLENDEPTVKIPNELLIQPNKPSNPFVLKRKVKPTITPIKTDACQSRKRPQSPKSPLNVTNKREKIEKPLAVSPPHDGVKSQVNEFAFTLNLQHQRRFSQITVTNAEATTPTGNIMLPPLISLMNAEATSDHEEKDMEVDNDLSKQNVNVLKQLTSDEDIFSDVNVGIPSINEENIVAEEKEDPPMEIDCADIALSDETINPIELSETIKEIASFQLSLPPLNLSEDEMPDVKHTHAEKNFVTPVKKIIQPTSLTSGGKNFAMAVLQLQATGNSSTKGSPDLKLDSLEDNSKVIADEVVKDVVVEKITIADEEKKRECNLPLDDDNFEPDYEPDD